MPVSKRTKMAACGQVQLPSPSPMHSWRSGSEPIELYKGRVLPPDPPTSTVIATDSDVRDLNNQRPFIPSGSPGLSSHTPRISLPVPQSRSLSPHGLGGSRSSLSQRRLQPAQPLSR